MSNYYLKVVIEPNELFYKIVCQSFGKSYFDSTVSIGLNFYSKKFSYLENSFLYSIWVVNPDNNFVRVKPAFEIGSSLVIHVDNELDLSNMPVRLKLFTLNKFLGAEISVENFETFDHGIKELLLKNKITSYDLSVIRGLMEMLPDDKTTCIKKFYELVDNNLKMPLQGGLDLLL